MLDGLNIEILTCIAFKALVEHALIRNLCGTVFSCDDDHGTLVGGRGAVRVHGVAVYEHCVGESPFGIQSQYIGAVSYTHLRAHETGRNLVCRLLLEKKKKNHNHKKKKKKTRTSHTNKIGVSKKT